MSDSGLKSIVADLHAMGYRGSDIARVVSRTPQRINAILRELGLVAPPLHSIDDLPFDLKERVKLWRIQNEIRPPHVSCETS